MERQHQLTVERKPRWWWQMWTPAGSKPAVQWQQKHSFIKIWPALHHLLLTNNPTIPPFFLTLFPDSLSAQILWKPAIVVLESGILSCNHNSVKPAILHSQYSHFNLANTSSSSILFAKDLTLPMMIDGKTGLYFFLSTLLLHTGSAPTTSSLTHRESGTWF